MNQLSWTIYLAQVVPNLVGLLVTLSWLLFLPFMAYAFFCLVNNGATYWHDTDEEKKAKREWFSEKKYLPPKWFVTLILCMWVVAAIAPNRQTIYMIAASQAAESVVASELGEELMGDLREILSYQINRLKESNQ